MSHRTAVAGVGLLALALTPSVAEARFGKAGSGSSSGSRSSGSSSSSSSSSSHHAAVPASSDGSSGSSGSDGSGASPAQPAPATPFYGASGHRSAWAFGYRPWWWTPAPYGYYDGSGLAPAYGYPPPPYAYAGPAAVNLSAEGQAHNQGALLGFNLAFERDRVGLAGQFQAIFAMAEDGSGDLDTIKLANVYFTYAILSDPHGRLRLEVGGASAFAPDLIALGPSGGVSGAWASCARAVISAIARSISRSSAESCTDGVRGDGVPRPLRLRRRLRLDFATPDLASTHQAGSVEEAPPQRLSASQRAMLEFTAGAAL